MQPDRRRTVLSCAAACAAAVLFARSAHAVDYSWTLSADGNWTDASKWSPNSGTPAAGDSAAFNAAGVNGNVNVYLSGNQAANSLSFSNTGTTTLNTGISGTPVANQTLTLSSGLTVNSGAGAVTIGTSATGNLVTTINGSATIANNSSNLLTFDSGSSAGTNSLNGVAASNALTLSGSGNMLFAGGLRASGGSLSLTMNNTGVVEFVGSSSTFTGGITLNAGVLAIRSANALGTTATTLTIDGGALAAVASARNVPAAVSLVLGQNATFGVGSGTAPDGAGFSNLSFAGTVSFSGPTTNINVLNNATFNAPVNFTGLSSATVNANDTTIFSNTVDLGGASPTFNSAGGVNTTLSGQVTGSGGFTKTGSGGLIILNNSATTPNNYTGPTSVLAGSLTLGNSTIGNAALPSTTALTLASGATFNASATGSITIGSLSDYQGAGGEIRMGNIGADVMTIGTDNTNTTFSGTFTGNDTNAIGGIVKVGSGTLTLTGTSTFSGYVRVRNGTLAFTTIGNVGDTAGSSLLAPFGGVNATAVAQATIPLGNADTTGTLKYVGTGPASSDRVIDLAGTTGGGGLDASGSGPITFTGNLTATGAGAKTLTLSGSNTGANTLQGVIPDSSGGATSVTKTGTGQWILNGANTYTGLTTVDGGTLVLGPAAWAPALSPAGADVKAGKLVFDYTATSSPASSVFSQIAAGAIKTTNASATRTVGMLDDGASKVTVAFTYYGDANLDFRLNADDYALIDRGYAKGFTGWVNGDFNYDGVINADDYLLIDSTYIASGVPHDAQAALLADREARFGIDYVNTLLTSVPEPGSLSLLAVAAAPLFARRRRSR